MLQQALMDDDCLRRGPEPTPGRGRVISTKTAQQIATKLTDARPALRIFAATGVVTPELYVELARLYDLRRPEVERWLDARRSSIARRQSVASTATTSGRPTRASFHKPCTSTM